jgi:hypothetical protein
MQDDRDFGAGDLPGRFAPGEAAADDMDRFHRPLVTKRRGLVNQIAARWRAQKENARRGRIRRALKRGGIDWEESATPALSVN